MFGHRNDKGAIVVDGQHSADTTQCVHCGAHFVDGFNPLRVTDVSRVEPGFCGNCMGKTCGKADCKPCVPYEVQLDFMEEKLTPFNAKYFPAWVEIQKLRGVELK